MKSVMRGALLTLAALMRAHAMACPTGCKCFNSSVWMEYSCVTQRGRLKAVQQGDRLGVLCIDRRALTPLRGIPALTASPAVTSDVIMKACLPHRVGWNATLHALGATQVRKFMLQAPVDPPLYFWNPQHFEGLGGLNQLGLSGEGQMPSDLLVKFGALNSLVLWFISLPPSLSLPSTLKRIEFRRCKQAELLERAFASAPGLLHLQLHGTKRPMRLAPRALAGLTQLQSVNLRYVTLDTLPPRWLALPALKEVQLTNCLLRELPADLLVGCSLLQNLSFAENQLEMLPPTLLEGLSALRWLDLHNNKLKALPPTLLAPVRHLHFLMLGQNQLVELGQTVFSTKSDRSYQLQELERLDLSFNGFNTSTLEELNFLIFGNMTLELDLRHNKIKTVIFPPQAARPRARVLLAANPISCDCSLYDTLRHAAPFGTLNITGSFCLTPKELYSNELSKVPLELLTCSLAAPACPPTCACKRRPGLATGQLTLDCPAPPPAPAWPNPEHYQLRASALRLTSAPASLALTLPQHCRNLSLAALNLTRLPPGPLPLLVLLDLSDNLLQELPNWLLLTKTHLLLRGNPLRCDCAVADSIAQLQRAPKRVDDWEALRCADGAMLSRVSVRPCPAMPWLAMVGLGAVGVGLSVVAVALALCYGRELRGWVAARGMGCCWPADAADGDEGGKCFDAFISFAHGDERWVVGELVPRLERAGLRLCLHFRDWEVGGWIPAQIERSVRQARRTLLVVSERYLASQWARHEWRVALAQARPRLVLLLLGQLPAGGAGLPGELHKYMAQHTYVKVGDPWFWSKLRVALPRRPLGPAPRPCPSVACRVAFDDRLDAVSAPPAPSHDLALAIATTRV